MKNIGKIRELYDLVTEAEDKDARKLTALVRAGLFDAKKLPALKRALDKSADKMTSQDKRLLINLLDALMSEVLNSQQVYSKVKQNVSHEKLDEAIKGQGYLSKYDPRGEKGYPKQDDMPAVIVLKRKAIRVYPDNTKVALYYSQAIDKYVSIPFGETGVSSINEQQNQAGVGPNQTVGIGGSPTGPTTNKKQKKKNKSQGLGSNRLSIQKKYDKTYEKGGLRGYTSRVTQLKSHGADGLTAGVVAAMPNLFKNKIKKKVETIRNKKVTYEQNDITESFSSRLNSLREEYTKKDAALDAADIATDFIPGVSNVKSAALAVRDVAKGDYGSAAINAVGAIPVVGNALKWIKGGAKAAKVASKVAKGANEVEKVTDVASKTTKVIKPKEGSILSKSETTPSSMKDITPSSSTSVKTAEKPDIKLPDIETSSSKNLPATTKGSNLPAKVEPKTNLPAKVEPKTSTEVSTKVEPKTATQTGTKTKSFARRAGRAAVAGLAASAIGSALTGSGSSSDSEGKFTKGDYNFGLKPKTSRAGEFDPLKATHQRDVSSNRKFMNQPVNESALSVIRNCVAENLEEATITFGDKKITINNSIANKINNLYEMMNKTNKQNMEKMINESASSFSKVLTFSVRY